MISSYNAQVMRAHEAACAVAGCPASAFNARECATGVLYDIFPALENGAPYVGNSPLENSHKWGLIAAAGAAVGVVLSSVETPHTFLIPNESAQEQNSESE